jgi:cysteine-rich repeat protein
VLNGPDSEIPGPEECDNGVNNSQYGDASEGACAPGCIKPANCGDGVVARLAGEQCDDGINDGSYGGCNDDCTFAPHCGDGVLQKEFEECDDVENDGGYGECAPGCVLGPHCGDGSVHPDFEECDDANDINNDGCTNACQKIVVIV